MVNMKINKFLPYLLPLISIIALATIALTNPGITGLAVANDKEIVNSQVRIFLDKDSMLPKESIVVVGLDGKESSMSLTEFIERSGGFKELINAEIKEINYKGEGFKGENIYDLDLSEFKLGLVDKKKKHEMIIKVVFNDKVLIENKKIIDGSNND